MQSRALDGHVALEEAPWFIVHVALEQRERSSSRRELAQPNERLCAVDVCMRNRELEATGLRHSQKRLALLEAPRIAALQGQRVAVHAQEARKSDRLRSPFG